MRYVWVARDEPVQSVRMSGRVGTFYDREAVPWDATGALAGQGDPVLALPGSRWRAGSHLASIPEPERPRRRHRSEASVLVETVLAGACDRCPRELRTWSTTKLGHQKQRATRSALPDQEGSVPSTASSVRCHG
jgi:hypothetical protein